MYALRLLSAAVIAASTLGGCNVPITPPVPPPSPQERGACDAFCELIAHLECEGHEGSPGEDMKFGTADDVACPKVCRDMLEGDIYASDRPCLDTAQTCRAAEDCVFDGGGQG